MQLSTYVDGNLLKFEMGEIMVFYTHTSTLTEPMEFEWPDMRSH